MNRQAWDRWRNALAPRGEPRGTLPLARDGQALVSIALPAEPTTMEQKAAADLALYLGRIAQAEFAITNGPADAALHIETCAALGSDGIRLSLREDGLHLAGGTGRGVINAVYAFLEEDLGCRWYGNGAERIPVDPSLTVAVVEREHVPQLKLRDPYTYASFDADWSLKNRTSAPDAPVPAAWGGHCSYPGSARGVPHGKSLFVHSYHQLLSPEDYFEEHPEYFGLTDSGERNTFQLCETHPDVQRIVTESVLHALRQHPDTSLLSVSRMDAGGTCRCPRCKALNTAEGSDAAGMLTLVNTVAEQVEPVFPDVTITTLAYLETIHLPQTVRPRRNVGIRLCNDKGAWHHPFTPVRECDELVRIVESWCAVCERMFYWDYGVNFSHYAAPFPNLHVIADNIRFWTEHNAVGIMTQGAFQCEGGERDLLRSWVIAKLLWDPRLDVAELEQDFTWGYFGQAAAPIAAYNELLRRHAATHAQQLQKPRHGIRFDMTESFLNNGFVAQAEALYAQAFALAGNDRILRDRIERDYLPILYVKLQQYTGAKDTAHLATVNTFERVARRIGFDYPAEKPAPNLEHQLALWR